MSQPSACRSSASSLGILSGWAWRAAIITAVLLTLDSAGVVVGWFTVLVSVVFGFLAMVDPL
jgi:hypothetical protein